MSIKEYRLRKRLKQGFRSCQNGETLLWCYHVKELTKRQARQTLMLAHQIIADLLCDPDYGYGVEVFDYEGILFYGFNNGAALYVTD